jgi:hypothetical protein
MHTVEPKSPSPYYSVSKEGELKPMVIEIKSDTVVSSNRPCHGCRNFQFRRVTTEETDPEARIEAQQLTKETCLTCGITRPRTSLKIYRVKSPPERRKQERG